MTAKQVKRKLLKDAGLDKRAMLIDLSVGKWRGRKKDRDVTHEVIDKKKAEKDAGSWRTQLVSRAKLRGVNQAEDNARATHNLWTLPWSDEGWRVLPAATFLNYTAEMRKRQQEFEKEVTAFLRQYPDIVKAASKRLGGLYVKDNFPTLEELRAKFSWRVDVMPMPVAGDFRVTLGKEEADQIRANIQKRSDELMVEAMSDLWRRLYKVVAHVVERLADPDAIFRDSLLQNVRDLCGLLTKLNITGDTELEGMRKDVAAKLVKADPGVLRIDPVERKKTADAAKAILAKVAGYMKKK